MSSLDNNAIWQVAYWTKMSYKRNYGASLQYDHLRRNDTTCSTNKTENNEKKKSFDNDRMSFTKENKEFLNPLTKHFRESLRTKSYSTKSYNKSQKHVVKK